MDADGVVVLQSLALRMDAHQAEHGCVESVDSSMRRPAGVGFFALECADVDEGPDVGRECRSDCREEEHGRRQEQSSLAAVAIAQAAAQVERDQVDDGDYRDVKADLAGGEAQRSEPHGEDK